MYNYQDDPRIEEMYKLVSALISSSSLEFTDILLIDNKMISIIDNTLMLEIPLKSNIVYNDPVGISYSLIGRLPNLVLDGKYCYTGNDVIDKVSHLYNYYSMKISNSPIIAQDNEISSNDKFFSLCNLKSADGVKFYRMPRNDQIISYCLVPMFSGLLRFNKGDTSGLTIYDIEPDFLLIDFAINKKKIGRTYHMYYKTLKLI